MNKYKVSRDGQLPLTVEADKFYVEPGGDAFFLKNVGEKINGISGTKQNITEIIAMIPRGWFSLIERVES